MSSCYFGAAELSPFAPVRCDDCNWTGEYEDLEPIQHVEQRLDPGGVVPAGECPKCGALAYLVTRKAGTTLDEALDDWAVFAPGAWENEDGPRDWWAVATVDGIVAYFNDETAAFRFRLSEINRLLNG